MPSCAASVRGGDRSALAREERQDPQRLIGGGDLWVASTVRREVSGMTDTGCHGPLSRARADGVESRHDHRHRPPSAASSPSAPHPLRPEDVVAVARHGARVELDAAAMARVAASRALVEGLADDPEPHYGISTGFGALATTFIAPERRLQLQASLIRSHAAGTGAEVEREVVRALQLLRLQTLATGHTGVRPVVVETYAAMLNAGITPIVREYGSLGCSGDLAPLSHVALAAMGEGRRARRRRRTRSTAAEALAAASITPLELREKEGLALINGTDGMLGMLLLALHDLSMLLDTADVAAAMSIESQLGTDAVFAADLMALRPQVGQAASAANLRAFLAGLADRGLAPRPGRLHARAGRVLAALLAAGARRRARHRRPRAHDRVPRARRRRSTTPSSPTTAASSRTATSTARRSRTCSTSSRSPSPTSPRSRSAAPTAPSTRRAATGCRRSSRTRSASTRAS